MMPLQRDTYAAHRAERTAACALAARACARSRKKVVCSGPQRPPVSTAKTTRAAAWRARELGVGFAPFAPCCELKGEAGLRVSAWPRLAGARLHPPHRARHERNHSHARAARAAGQNRGACLGPRGTRCNRPERQVIPQQWLTHTAGSGVASDDHRRSTCHLRRHPLGATRPWSLPCHAMGYARQRGDLPGAPPQWSPTPRRYLARRWAAGHGGPGSRARRRSPPQAARPTRFPHAAATSWARRWWTQLSVAVQRATALSAAGAWRAASPAAVDDPAFELVLDLADAAGPTGRFTLWRMQKGAPNKKKAHLAIRDRVAQLGYGVTQYVTSQVSVESFGYDEFRLCRQATLVVRLQKSAL